MKKLLIPTIAILACIMSSCIGQGHVCNTYTDNTIPQVEKTIQNQ